MTPRSFASRYHVDDVPIALRPLHDLVSYSLGFLLFAYARLVYHSSRVNLVGRDELAVGSNHIFCFWHVFSPLTYSVFYRPRRHAWMQHPSWLTKHVHVISRLLGVNTLVFGSSGHGGRTAADKIVEYLKEGYSTIVFPDAPRGPPFVLKDGVLHMSLKSRVPVVPIRFQVKRYVELRGWDRKKLPLPFGVTRAEFGRPIQVSESNIEQARRQLVEALGHPDEGHAPTRTG
jgi:lysophospholipid acyltransferase (LPLAT)-like uncharacterized protein